MNLYVIDYEGGQQYILDKITKIICAQPRIRTLKRSKHCLNQKDEIFGMSTIEWNTIPWMRTTLPQDRAVKLSKARVHVYSDSVLCLGKIPEHPQTIEAWK